MVILPFESDFLLFSRMLNACFTHKTTIMEKILITGASGFIGSFLVEEAHARRFDVWAGIRATSSRKYLQAEWLNVLALDMTDAAVLRGQMERFKAKYGKWDVIVHAAGATKCLHAEDFMLHNYTCTKNLVDTLVSLDMMPRKFIYMSSLSVTGPVRDDACPPSTVTVPQGLPATGQFVDRYTVRESVYSDISMTDTACPNTAYGESKLKTEEYLRQVEGLPWVVLRPTGVYGPRERDYFLMAKSIKNHVDFSVGYQPQEITFVYVKDLVGAVFAAVEKDVYGRTYFVSDGYVYTSRAFSDLLQEHLGVKSVLHIKAPLWVLRGVSAVAEFWSGLTGKTSTLNGDKYKIMKQRNWRCDVSGMVDELGYIPQWNLQRGVEETVNWYKKEKWI